MKTAAQIPIIDIFAGPGGLAEGFSSNSNFKICLSIEKDEVAHKTLELRSFVRSFPRGRLPDEYYKYVRGEIDKAALFLAHPDAAKHAQEEAWCVELGNVPSETLHSRIDKSLGGAKDWVLIGGPPCQAYSLVGRSRLTGLGNLEELEDEELVEALMDARLEKFRADHRHTLYKEYLKIVAVHSPSVFVMENVKGILSSKHEELPVFERILEDLREPWKAVLSDQKIMKDQYVCSRKPKVAPKYRIYSFVKPVRNLEPEKHLKPADFVIRSEQYGVPQKRHRVILLGIRDDCAVTPDAIKPLLKPRTVKEVIGDLPALRSGLSKEDDGEVEWQGCISDGVRRAKAGKKDTDFHLVLDKAEQKSRKNTSRGAVCIKAEESQVVGDGLLQWLIDNELRCVLQHETRGHMKADLWR
jgi:DNA (cytosine-5)-methyltransferase 1